MASVTSLLRQAESARKRKLEFEDQMAAYEWSISAKTRDDFLDYSTFLADRLKNSPDPSKALSYQRTITSTRRSYVSHEIQRQAIDILEGRQNSQGKYNVMVDLYQAAVGLGDMDLAQQLRLQLDSLDRTTQGEQARGNSVASTMASAQADSIEDTIRYIVNDPAEDGAFKFIDAEGNERVLPTMGALRKIYENGGEEGINQVASLVADATGGAAGNYWDVAGAVIEQIIQLNQDAAEMVGLDTSKGRTFLNYARKIQSGETKFTIAPGLPKISYQDVQGAIKAARAGQQLFIPAQREGKNVFERTKVVDYVWGRDENGNYEIIPVRQEFGDDFSDESTSMIKLRKADGTTEEISPADVKSRLSNLGFNVGTEDGRLILGTSAMQQNPQLAALGILPGTSFDLVIGEDGNLRFITPDSRILDLELGENDFQLNEVTKEEMSVFGDNRLNQFGRASKEGISLIKQITRQDDRARQSDLLQRTFAPQMSTSGVLSNAHMTAERIRLQQQEEAAARALLQPAAAAGLNYTPVPANSQIRVEPIRLPTTNLRVTETKLPTTSLRVTDSTPRVNNLQVTASKPAPKVVVNNTPIPKTTLKVL